MRVLLNLLLPLCALAALVSVVWLAIPHSERWRSNRTSRGLTEVERKR